MNLSTVAGSWQMTNESATKTLDKSVFKYRGTSIHKSVLSFFDIYPGPPGYTYTLSLPVVLHCYDERSDGITYEARIQPDKHGRFRLFWSKDLADIINARFQAHSEAFKNNTTPPDGGAIVISRRSVYRCEFAQNPNNLPFYRSYNITFIGGAK